MELWTHSSLAAANAIPNSAQPHSSNPSNSNSQYFKAVFLPLQWLSGTKRPEVLPMLLKCIVSYPAADGCLGERVGDRRARSGAWGGEERERAEQSSTFTEFKPSDGRLEQREPWMGIGDEGLVWKQRPEEGHQVSLHLGLSWRADVALLSESATLLNFAFPLPLQNLNSHSA